MSRFLVLAHDGEEADDMKIIGDDEDAGDDDDDDEGVLVDNTSLNETEIINTLHTIVALLQKIVQCLEQR